MCSNFTQMKHKMSGARSTDLSGLGATISPLITACLNYYNQPPSSLLFTIKNYAQRGMGSDECFRPLVPQEDVDVFDADREEYAAS
jgi:hypothetical protein